MFASRGWGLTVKGRRETYMLLHVSIRVCVYIYIYHYIYVLPCASIFHSKYREHMYEKQRVKREQRKHIVILGSLSNEDTP